jgi:RNA polymerase sigma-70 factor (ECF subfamily)
MRPDSVDLAEGFQTGMASDEELMSAVAGGDLDAFGEIVVRYQAPMYRAARRFLGRGEDAQDVAQEAFLRLLGAAPRYKPTASLKTFLYRIVSNLCMDRKRRRKHEPLEGFPELTDAALSPMDQMIRSERERAVHEALYELPDRQRMAVVLRHFEGMSYGEMAEVLDTSEKGIEGLLRRGRGALLRELGPLLGGWGTPSRNGRGI